MDSYIKVRIFKEDKEQLKAIARRERMSVSAYIRNRVLASNSWS